MSWQNQTYIKIEGKWFKNWALDRKTKAMTCKDNQHDVKVYYDYICLSLFLSATDGKVFRYTSFSATDGKFSDTPV